MVLKALMGVTVLLAVANVGLATPHEYLIPWGPVTVCNPTGSGPDIGGVCIPAGHIVPDMFGQVTILIVDDIVAAPSGFVCQDVNGDSICGGPGELAAFFCSTITFTPDPTAAIHVTIDGPVFGNPALSTCGDFSFGTHGSVYHT